MKKIICLGLVWVSVIMGAAFASAPKTIRFATESTYPPFEFVDESGLIQGYDIDIAKALCEQMKAQCTFSNQSFSSLIPSLQLGKFDALIAAMNITEERKKQVSFTNAYYQPSACFIAPTAKHYAVDNLIGKTIGVQQSSTFEKYMQDKYGSKVTIKSYASIQDAFLDLVSGRVDVVFTDMPIADAWLKQNDNSKTYSMMGSTIVDPAYFGTGYGIAVRKHDVELQQALNSALAAIKANGTYAKIVKTYFGK